MASPRRWTWVWVGSGSWWLTGKPGMLQSLRSQRDWHDWATELSWLLLNLEQVPIHQNHSPRGHSRHRHKRALAKDNWDYTFLFPGESVFPLKGVASFGNLSLLQLFQCIPKFFRQFNSLLVTLNCITFGTFHENSMVLERLFAGWVLKNTVII